MSQKEVGRLRVLEQVVQGVLNQDEAAAVLQLSVRQLRRIQRRYEAGGASALVHGLRGRAPNRTLDAALVRQAQQLVAQHYADFGPTLACEMLAQRHGIMLSVESVRTLMRAAGLWRARRRRGELIQIDGSPHDWFEGRGPRCTLLVFIDDATSELTALRFARAETTADYLRLLRQHILAHGLPMCLYSDRHSIFRSTSPQDPSLPVSPRRLSAWASKASRPALPRPRGVVIPHF